MCVFDDMMLMLVNVFDQLLYFAEGGNKLDYLCVTPPTVGYLAIKWYMRYLTYP